MSSHSPLRTWVGIMLQPIAAFCVARGVRIQDFIELAKGAFVRSAEYQLRAGRRELSVSKLSVMTGLQRPEIGRLQKSAGSEGVAKDIVTRVVGQWASDRRFGDRQGRPRPLKFGGKASEFSKLVAAVSKDLNVHTVRFELDRLGLISVEGDRIALLRPAHITTGDPAQTMAFGSEDVADLLKAVQQNAATSHEQPNLHARTQYDNIPDEAIPRIRGWLLELGARIHAECRDVLGQCDRDINPKGHTGSGRNRVKLATFSLVEEVDGPTEPSSGGDA